MVISDPLLFWSVVMLSFAEARDRKRAESGAESGRGRETGGVVGRGVGDDDVVVDDGVEEGDDGDDGDDDAGVDEDEDEGEEDLHGDDGVVVLVLVVAMVVVVVVVVDGTGGWCEGGGGDCFCGLVLSPWAVIFIPSHFSFLST